MRNVNMVYIAVAACLIMLSGCASTSQRGAMIRAYNGIEKGKYEFALKRLSEAEKYAEPTPELKAEISYLRGLCYEGLGRSAEAIGMYKYVADKFPDSQYSFKAREKLKVLQKE